MKEEIERALQALIGLPLWAVGRAGSLEWFQFGGRRTIPNLRGASKEVGEFAIHLDCAWRLVEPSGQVVMTDESQPDLLACLADPPLVCCGVSAAADGSVRMRLSDGRVLVVEPCNADSLEYWRMFRPGTEEPHFVVGPAGIEV